MRKALWIRKITNLTLSLFSQDRRFKTLRISVKGIRINGRKMLQTGNSEYIGQEANYATFTANAYDEMLRKE